MKFINLRKQILVALAAKKNVDLSEEEGSNAVSDIAEENAAKKELSEAEDAKLEKENEFDPEEAETEEDKDEPSKARDTEDNIADERSVDIGIKKEMDRHVRRVNHALGTIEEWLKSKNAINEENAKQLDFDMEDLDENSIVLLEEDLENLVMDLDSVSPDEIMNRLHTFHSTLNIGEEGTDIVNQTPRPQENLNVFALQDEAQDILSFGDISKLVKHTPGGVELQQVQDKINKAIRAANDVEKLGDVATALRALKQEAAKSTEPNYTVADIAKRLFQ